jgi:GNAT superfamily N-acetyltransferase
MDDSVEIRAADSSDVETVIRLNPAASERAERAELIRESVDAGRAFVAVWKGRVVGYAVLEHFFFGNGFVRLLYVQPDHRRRGIASALMTYAEQITRTPKLFTSCNQSNLPMQELLDRLGYQRSGIVENLEEGAPELIYSKRLPPTT